MLVAGFRQIVLFTIFSTILAFGALYGQSERQFVESWSGEKNNSIYTLSYSGQEITKGRMVKGVRHGEWLFKYTNGKTRAEGAFNRGRFFGEWTFYDKSGEVSHTYNIDESDLDVQIFSDVVSESDFYLFDEPFTDVLDVDPFPLIDVPFHHLYTLQKPESMKGQRNISLSIEVNCTVQLDGSLSDCIFMEPIKDAVEEDILSMIDQSPVIWFPGVYKGLPVIAKTRIMKFKVQFQ